MFATKQLDDLAAKLCSILPSNFQNFNQDMKQQFKAVLQSAFQHMDLVTREEFDVQVKVLARTREKVDALEAKIHALEQQKE